MYSCKVPVILDRLDFLLIFSKNTQISNFMSIQIAGNELFHADRLTDITKLIVAFQNFAKSD